MPGKKGPARVHTGIRLDANIVERLSAGGRALSDEIRERLERTFREDDLDPVTRELLMGIVNIAAVIHKDFGEAWHRNRTAREVFRAAVTHRINAYPKDWRKTNKDTPRVPPDAVGVPAEMLGMIREADDAKDNSQSYPHMAERGPHLIHSIRMPKKGED